MPLKSTINVDADVDKLRQLNAQFDKYSKALKTQGDLWSHYQHRLKDVQKAHRAISQNLKEQGVALGEATRLHSNFSGAADKAGKSFQSLAKDAKKTSESLVKSASSLFEISIVTGAIFGLLGSGFGVYVLDRSAGLVMDRRRQSMGLGSSYGGLQSFETNFSRFGIGDQTVQATATGTYDITSPEYLALHTAHATGGDTSAATVDMLRKLPSFFAGISDEMIGPTAERYGFTNLLSIREIVTYLHASPQERQQQLDRYATDSKFMNLSKEAQSTWADFDTAMTSAGIKIESILGRTLVGLADPLSDLSRSAVNFIDALLEEKKVNSGIISLGEGIDWLAKEVNSSEFKQSLKDFGKGLEGMLPYLILIGNVLKIVTKAGISVYRLWSDPNYNPSAADLAGDLLGQARPDSSSAPALTGTGRSSLRYYAGRGGDRPRYGGIMDPSTGKMEPTPQFRFSPGSGWNKDVGNIPPEVLAQVQANNPNLTPRQCVELVQSTISVGNVHDWRRGPSETNSPEGSALATFGWHGDSNLYAYGGSGTPGIGQDHALKLVKKYPDGSFDAVSQDIGHSAHLIHMPFTGKGGEGDASSYFAIFDKSGKPAGKNVEYFNSGPTEIQQTIANDRFSQGAQARSKLIRSYPSWLNDQINDGPKSEKQSFLKKNKIPSAVIVMNETAGSATVSARRIQIAT